MVIMHLSICYPYKSDSDKVDEIKRMVIDLNLTPLQAKKFVDDVYFSYQSEHGLYPNVAEFNYFANEIYKRYKRNLGKYDVAAENKSAKGHNETANPVLEFKKKWSPHND